MEEVKYDANELNAIAFASGALLFTRTGLQQCRLLLRSPLGFDVDSDVLQELRW